AARDLPPLRFVADVAVVVVARDVPAPRTGGIERLRPRGLGRRRGGGIGLPQRLRAVAPAQREATAVGQGRVVADVAEAVIARRRLGRVRGLVDVEGALGVDVGGDVVERAL